MSTVIRGPLWADLGGVWPETPWLLEQAARARQAATASTATPRQKPALLPGRTPLREQLPSCSGASPRLVCVIPEPSDLTWPHHLALSGSIVHPVHRAVKTVTIRETLGRQSPGRPS